MQERPAGHLYATCAAGLGEPETGVRKAKVNFIHQLPSAYFFPQECRGLCAGSLFFFAWRFIFYRRIEMRRLL